MAYDQELNNMTVIVFAEYAASQCRWEIGVAECMYIGNNGANRHFDKVFPTTNSVSGLELSFELHIICDAKGKNSHPDVHDTLFIRLDAFHVVIQVKEPERVLVEIIWHSFQATIKP